MRVGIWDRLLRAPSGMATGGAPDGDAGSGAPPEGAVPPTNGAVDPGAGGDGDSGGGQVADWRDTITDPKIRQFADRFSTPADLAKTGLEFRQKLSSAVFVPGENATDDERAAFRKATNVPDTPEGYEIKIPDTLPDELKAAQNTDAAKARLDGFAKAMHEAGAPKAAVDAAVTMFYSMQAEDAAALKGDNERVTKAADDEIRKLWGKDYDANYAASTNAFKAFAPKGDDGTTVEMQGHLANFVYMGPDESKRGLPVVHDPAILGMFSEIGRRTADDGFHAFMPEDAKQSFEQKRRDLTTQMHEALDRGDRSTADRLNRERAAITERLVGTAPVVGAEGRQT